MSQATNHSSQKRNGTRAVFNNGEHGSSSKVNQRRSTGTKKESNRMKTATECMRSTSVIRKASPIAKKRSPTKKIGYSRVSPEIIDLIDDDDDDDDDDTDLASDVVSEPKTASMTRKPDICSDIDDRKPPASLPKRKLDEKPAAVPFPFSMSDAKRRTLSSSRDRPGRISSFLNTKHPAKACVTSLSSSRDKEMAKVKRPSNNHQSEAAARATFPFSKPVQQMESALHAERGVSRKTNVALKGNHYLKSHTSTIVRSNRMEAGKPSVIPMLLLGGKVSTGATRSVISTKSTLTSAVRNNDNFINLDSDDDSEAQPKPPQEESRKIQMSSAERKVNAGSPMKKVSKISTVASTTASRMDGDLARLKNLDKSHLMRALDNNRKEPKLPAAKRVCSGSTRVTSTTSTVASASTKDDDLVHQKSDKRYKRQLDHSQEDSCKEPMLSKKLFVGSPRKVVPTSPSAASITARKDSDLKRLNPDKERKSHLKPPPEEIHKVTNFPAVRKVCTGSTKVASTASVTVLAARKDTHLGKRYSDKKQTAELKGPSKDSRKLPTFPAAKKTCTGATRRIVQTKSNVASAAKIDGNVIHLDSDDELNSQMNRPQEDRRRLSMSSAGRKLFVGSTRKVTARKSALSSGANRSDLATLESDDDSTRKAKRIRKENWLTAGHGRDPDGKSVGKAALATATTTALSNGTERESKERGSSDISKRLSNVGSDAELQEVMKESLRMEKERQHRGVRDEELDQVIAQVSEKRPYEPFTNEEFKDMLGKVEVDLGLSLLAIEKGKLVKSSKVSKADSSYQKKNIYGRFLPNGFEFLREYLPMEKHHTVVDIGHGIANFVIQAAYTVGCTAKGIELDKDRYDVGLCMKMKIDEYIKIESDAKGVDRNLGTITLAHGRLEDPAHRDFLTYDVDVLFCNNFNGVLSTRADPSSRSRTPDEYIAGLFGLTKSGCRLITLHDISEHMPPPGEEESYYVMEKLECEGGWLSWTEKKFDIFIYTRVGQPRWKCQLPLCVDSDKRTWIGATEVALEGGEKRTVVSVCPNCKKLWHPKEK